VRTPAATSRPWTGVSRRWYTHLITRQADEWEPPPVPSTAPHAFPPPYALYMTVHDARMIGVSGRLPRSWAVSERRKERGEDNIARHRWWNEHSDGHVTRDKLTSRVTDTVSDTHPNRSGLAGCAQIAVLGPSGVPDAHPLV
jgi:hypothetical protein